MWRIFDRFIIPILFIALSATFVTATVAEIVSQISTPTNIATQEVEDKEECFAISQYDNIFKEIGAEYNIDWRFLASIARAESRFRFDAVSQAGAVGLMQIMPLVAHNMGYTREQLFDPRTNVEVAAKLLHDNIRMLHLPKSFDHTERLKFILACYNAGYSRIADARRLAQYYDANAEKWNIVALFLSWLSDPEFAECELVQSGAFHGSKETIEYVDKVIHLYTIYVSEIRL